MDNKAPYTRNRVLETAEGVLRGASALLLPRRRHKPHGWSATHEEVRRELPGDDPMPRVRWTATHAITINAPPEDVWPWVVQIGQGRGGFYSYAALENLFGAKITNADRILTEFQHTQVGDLIRMHATDALPAFRVARIEAPHIFLLAGAPSYDWRLHTSVGVTWLFYLERLPMNGTRLITRWRMYYEHHGPQNPLSFGTLLIEPLDFVMETRMLEGIRVRAEARAHQPEPEPKPPGLTGFQMPLRP